MDSAPRTIRKPFIEHIHELQVRLTWCMLSILGGGLIAYSLLDNLLLLIQKPLGQTLYYTSPTGAFSYVFKVCFSFGLLLSLPVIIYQALKFLSPLASQLQKSTIVGIIIWSIGLAHTGALFAYWVSLPAALNFLTHFGGQGVESLITANEYFSFALAYIAGFAVLFQLPLGVVVINKIKPLSPQKMMGLQRYVILFSFIVAAILTPTPDPFNQLIMALPIIILYQLSIVIIWVMNRKENIGSTKTNPVIVSWSSDLQNIDKPLHVMPTKKLPGPKVIDIILPSRG